MCYVEFIKTITHKIMYENKAKVFLFSVKNIECVNFRNTANI